MQRVPSTKLTAAWITHDASRITLLALAFVHFCTAHATILWSDLGATLAHDTGPGVDILGGALQRDNSASDTLYFKFHLDPLSDVSTEEYAAGFQLFENDSERLGVGNSFGAWAYSAFKTATSGQFNKVFGDIDLKSARPESSPDVSLPYELPRRGIGSTVVFRVQYVADDDDLITVWLNPDLAPGATEESQPQNLATSFKANASFNQIRLRHVGGGGGWTFSDMAIATSFSDFVNSSGFEPGGASAANARPSLFTFRTWQREQGLPQSSVHALLQTRDGYLWVGTDDGIARFDGVRFVPYGLREGLRSARVRTIYEDRSENLWIGTSGSGLTRWHQGRFNTLTVSNGLPADAVNALSEDSQRRLWIGTERGLVVWEHERLMVPEAAKRFDGKAVTALFKDTHGVLWAGVRELGIFRLHNANFVPFKGLTNSSTPPEGENAGAPNLIEELLREPHCLLVDRSARIWIGAADDYVLCYEADNWRRYRIARHLARPYISALAEAPDGTIWAGSISEGLFEFKEGKLRAINASSGLSDNLVETLLVDAEGNLWAGTGAGLTRLRRRNLSTFGPAEGLGYGPVQGLAEVSTGVVWVAKAGDGLYHWEGRAFSRLTGEGYPPANAVINCLLPTHEGSCWVGADKGLWRLQPGSIQAPKTPVPIFSNQSVLSLAEDRLGDVWAGTRDGQLWRFHQGTWVTQTNTATGRPITAIVHGADGSLWLGTHGAGLLRHKDGRWTQFDKNHGLLSDSIRALYLDSQGLLWIGSAGGGLSRWREGHFATFTSREGLPANTISQILEDDVGKLWLGSDRGLASLRKSELDELAAGKIPTLNPQIYGHAEGMLAEECTGGFSPAGLKTKSGLLWFSTTKGVVVADPHPQPPTAPAPRTILEAIVLDGVETTQRSPGPMSSHSDSRAIQPVELKIGPGNHRLEFHYTGLSFSAPERVRFRYRLEPLENEWVEAGSRRTAFYNYVPPGNYHFKVIACNADGIWSAADGGFGLVVLPHIYQSWWFIGLLGLALLGLAVGTARFLEKKKMRSHLKALEQERALERERARIAQDLHDDLGSSLTRISLLSDLAKADKDHPAQVEAHATKISQSASQTVRALEEIVWALRPGSDSLQSLIEYIAHFANELFENDSTRCRLDLPADLPPRPLPPEMRHNIFLIVKEALTNALKHADAREVHVSVKLAGSLMEVAVEDDGRGFAQPGASPNGERHGLSNMRQRASASNGKVDFESKPGAGTTVRLTVRLPALETAPPLQRPQPPG